MSNTSRMGILVGGGPVPGINSATAEPPATKANGLRKARRDKLPPRILLVVDTNHFSAQRQNLS